MAIVVVIGRAIFRWLPAKVLFKCTDLKWIYYYSVSLSKILIVLNKPFLIFKKSIIKLLLPLFLINLFSQADDKRYRDILFDSSWKSHQLIIC